MANKEQLKVSKILFSNGIEAASVGLNDKNISVFDGERARYIPNTSANRKQLQSRFGKAKVDTYRGKKRFLWFDTDVYELK